MVIFKNVISVEKCRQELGDIAVNITDKQIIELRDTIYAITEQIVDEYINTKNGKNLRLRE